METSDQTANPDKNSQEQAQVIPETQTPLSNDPMLNLILNTSKMGFQNLEKKVDEKFEKFEEKLKIVESLTTRMSDQETKVDWLVSENKLLLDELNVVKSENELLAKEIRKQNLVFVGLDDYENETVDQLYKKVSDILNSVAGRVINIDITYRVGKFVINKCRPIRIRFISLWDRETVYGQRKNLRHPFYLNEDLPFVTMRDHAILRKQKNELVNDGKNASIDWKNKTLRVNDIGIQKIVNGALINIDTSTQPESVGQLGQIDDKNKSPLKFNFTSHISSKTPAFASPDITNIPRQSKRSREPVPQSSGAMRTFLGKNPKTPKPIKKRKTK